MHTGQRLSQPLPDTRINTAMLSFVVLALILTSLAHLETIVSMVSIWSRSETFTHGFFVAPISLYLIWQKREALRAQAIEHNYWALIPLMMTGFIWLVADLVDVAVVKQLMVVALFPQLVWLLAGTRVVLTILFPLLFLFFSVPAGEALIPLLMEFTADFTVWAIQVSNIPIYREGLYFSIPSGRFEVAKACSGIRYLIASTTIGVLYAYMSFESYSRRALLIAVAIILPVIANGVRAYLIVIIAHLTDLKHAVGVDHLVYGWLFFGVVILLLMGIGRLFAEAPKAEENRAAATHPHSPKSTNSAMIFVAALLSVAIFPASALYIGSNTSGAADISVSLPDNIGGWALLPENRTEWRPDYQNANAEWQGSFQKGDKTVGVYLAAYNSSNKDAELINSNNVLVQENDTDWQILQTGQYDLDNALLLKRASTATVQSAHGKLVVWHWYVINGAHTNNKYIGKLQEAAARLLGRNTAFAIVLYTEADSLGTPAQEVLELFLRESLVRIDTGLQALASD